MRSAKWSPRSRNAAPWGVIEDRKTIRTMIERVVKDVVRPAVYPRTMPLQVSAHHVHGSQATAIVVRLREFHAQRQQGARRLCLRSPPPPGCRLIGEAREFGKQPGVYTGLCHAGVPRGTCSPELSAPSQNSRTGETLRSDRMLSLIGHNYTTLSSLTSVVTAKYDNMC